MELVSVETLLTVLGTIEYVILIAICVRRLSFRRSMAPVFFTFALVSILMSGLYWLAFGLLRPGVRMPFAANEFGEIGLLLLFASALNVVFRDRTERALREVLCTVFFVAASVALWIAWSGEWLQDILTGFCFSYFLLVCVRSMKCARVLSRTEWRLLAVLAAGTLALQSLTFVLPEPWAVAADYGAYAVMFTGLICGVVKFVRAFVRRQEPAGLFALGLSVWAWSVSTMYMSGGWFYPAAEIAYVALLPLIMLALRREEEAA